MRARSRRILATKIDPGAGTLDFHTEAGPNAYLSSAALWRMCRAQQVLFKGSVSNSPTLERAREGFRRLMQAPQPPTAVLCAIDVLAIGALLEAATLGIEVPRQVSVTGFDDLEMARHIQPSLTTMHVPTERMWQMVADRIIASLDQVPMPRVAKVEVEVEVELIVRSSTGPAPSV